jgi:hypothetical protein
MSAISPDVTDEAVVRALAEKVEHDLITVLDDHAAALVAAGSPRFARHLLLHVGTSLLGRLMRAMLDIDGEDARATIEQRLTQLELFVAGPSGQRAS